MAGMLLCTRAVSRLNLCRSLSQARWPVKKKLYLCLVEEWSKMKNPWEDDRIIRDSKSARTQNLESTTKEQGLQAFVAIENRRNDQTDALFVRLHKQDYGPHADAYRTHSYNVCLKSFVSFFWNDKPAHRIARPFLTDMIVNGAIPDLATFSLLIRFYCKHYKYRFILDVVHTQMKALGVQADEAFYKTLIYGVCARFGPNVGFQLLKDLRSNRGLQMPLACYDALVRRFYKKKTTTNVSVLIDVFMDMKQQRVFPDYKIYDCLIRGRRSHCSEGFLKAGGVGRQIFLEGVKIGALSNIVKKKHAKGRLEFVV